MKNNLPPEESQRLIDLGVDRKMVSTTCINFNGTYAYVSGEESETVRDCVNGQYYTEECRCFSIADILSILPKEIVIEGEKEDLNIVMDNFGALVGYPKFHEKHGCAFVNSELIDALYSLLIWCLENKIIKLKED